jgi:hypothetical protein
MTGGDDFNFLSDLVSGEELAEDNSGVTDLSGDFAGDTVIAEEEQEEPEEEVQPKEDETPEEGQETPKEEEPESVSTFGQTMSALVEKGVLHYDESKEYEDSEEGFNEMINDTVNQRINSLFEGNDNVDQDIVKAFKYILSNKDNATIDGLIDVFNTVDYNTIDIDNDAHQSYVIEDDLKSKGLSSEKIAETVKAYEAAGIKKIQAEISQKNMISLQERKEAERRSNLENQERARREQFEKENLEYRNRILTKNKIAGMELSKEERESLADYILKPVKDGKTQVMIDEDGDSDLLYAYIKKNKITLDKLVKVAQTKEVVKFKKKVDNYTDSNSRKPSSRSPRVDDTEGSLSALDSWMS